MDRGDSPWVVGMLKKNGEDVSESIVEVSRPSHNRYYYPSPRNQGAGLPLSARKERIIVSGIRASGFRTWRESS